MKTDNDTFNRWEAAQTAAYDLLGADIDGRNSSASDRKSFIAALRAVLDDREVDHAFKSAMLTLPSEQEIATLIADNVDPGAIHDTREALRAEIGKGLGDILLHLWKNTESRGELQSRSPRTPGDDRCAMPCSMPSPAAIRSWARNSRCRSLPKRRA